MSAIVVTLPVPPSANRYWRNVGVRTLLSREARQYKAAVAAHVAVQCGAIVMLTAPVTITLSWYREAKRGDLDNRIKVALDALAGIVYASDAQIVAIHAYRHEDRVNPRLIVIAEAVTP